MSCSEKGEQKQVTLSKPEGWEVTIVGSHWRGRVKKKVQRRSWQG